SLWPPTKLYLGKPFHLTAGGGRPDARRGAKSSEVVMRTVSGCDAGASAVGCHLAGTCRARKRAHGNALAPPPPQAAAGESAAQAGDGRHRLSCGYPSRIIYVLSAASWARGGGPA